MKLTDTAIRKAKLNATAYRLSDGRSLSLLVTLEGGKWWRDRYRVQGRERTLSFGVYLNVTLGLARARLLEVRCVRASGIDRARSARNKNKRALIALKP